MISGKICSLRAMCTIMAIGVASGQIFYAPRVLAPASFYSYYRPFPSVLAPTLPVAAAPAVPIGPPVAAAAPAYAPFAAAPVVAAAPAPVVPAYAPAVAAWGWGSNKGKKSFSPKLTNNKQ